VNEAISYKADAAYHVILQFKIVAGGSDWQLVSILLSPFGVSSLYHCKMESCVELILMSSLLNRWTRKVRLCRRLQGVAISTDLTLDNVSRIVNH